jgi:hypothetical protein
MCFRPAAAANETLAAAQQIAAALLGGVTPVVLLENMMNAATIRSADERQEVSTRTRVVHTPVHLNCLMSWFVAMSATCRFAPDLGLLYLPPQPDQLFTDSAVISAVISNCLLLLQVSEMVYEESVRCGKVLGIAVPVPPPEVADDESSRVYIKYATSGEAAKCKEMMDGRMFDDSKVRGAARVCG